jgi:hypothetical protein
MDMNRHQALTEALLCVKSADGTSDPEHRDALLELAGWWSQQAERASGACDREEPAACWQTGGQA